MAAYTPISAPMGGSESNHIYGLLPTNRDFYLQDVRDAGITTLREASPLADEVGEETYIIYYQHLVAFVYFTTGCDTEEVLSFLPNTFQPTAQQSDKILAVIDKIKDMLITGGLGVEAVAEMMKTYDWSQYAKDHPEVNFNTRDNRVEFFRSEFEKNPTTILQILGKVSPALDLHAILSDIRVEGPYAYFNDFKAVLRKHLTMKMAKLAELLFSRKIYKDLEVTPDDVAWCKKHISSCFGEDRLTDGVYGSPKPCDWPIKQAIKICVGNTESWFRTPYDDPDSKSAEPEPDKKNVTSKVPSKVSSKGPSKASSKGPSKVPSKPSSKIFKSHLEPEEKEQVEETYQANPYLTVKEREDIAAELGIDIFAFRKRWDELNTRSGNSFTRKIGDVKKRIAGLPSPQQAHEKARFLAALHDGTL